MNSSPPLKIRKYANRRFYDSTRSEHVTIGQIHDLICEGHDVEIVDAATGENITNQVLTQIILDRQAPKLDVFPSNILHQIIRTQQSLLGSVIEQFFRQTLEMHRVSQERWTQFVQSTLGAAPTFPLGWTQAVMDAMFPAQGRPRPADSAPAGPSAPESQATSADDAINAARPAGPAPGGEDAQARELRELRRAVADLQARIDAFGSERPSDHHSNEGEDSGRA